MNFHVKDGLEVEIIAYSFRQTDVWRSHDIICVICSSRTI